ncbi:MAG: sigE 12, partial [Phycisphaerales bacterium]|nr:sigE 12 [Phycisphaerales bacterium]
ARRSHERAAAAQRPLEAAGGPAAAADAEAIRVEVHRAVTALPDLYREAVVLHHLQGWPVRDLAALLGCPAGTVAARLSRGRAMVRERLERRGLGVPLAAVAALLAEEFTRGRSQGATAPARTYYPPCGTALAAAGGAGTLAVPLSTCGWKVAAGVLVAVGGTAGVLAVPRGGPDADGKAVVSSRWSSASTSASGRSAGSEDKDSGPGLPPAYRPDVGGVPEPGSVAMIGIAAAGLLARRRRPRHG